MASTQQMQERAKALKKASALKEHLKNKAEQAKSFKIEEPTAIFVKAVHTDLRTNDTRDISAWVIPQVNPPLNKDELLGAICDGFMHDKHLDTKFAAKLLAALAYYVPMLTSYQMGKRVGHDGITINLFSDGQLVSCRQCITGDGQYLMSLAANASVLEAADGVQVKTDLTGSTYPSGHTKAEHDRSGHWVTSKLGKTFWRSGSTINKGKGNT